MTTEAELINNDQVTKSDPYLKTDQELLEIVMQRMALPSEETGITDFWALEGVIGALFVGQRHGLRILRIIHSSKTLHQYERFLGVPLEDLIPQRGPFIDRSYAWSVVSTTRRYWDLVARKIKMEGRERRSIVDTAT